MSGRSRSRRGSKPSTCRSTGSLGYVFDKRGEDHLELLLAYRARAGGRLKRARVFSDRGEAGFQGLLEALLERRPDVDLRALSSSEASKAMGAVEAEWIFLPGVMALACLVMAAVLAPMLVHGLDAASPERVAAAELAAGAKTATRNLVVTGAAPLVDKAVRAVRGVDERLGTQTLWVPLAPVGASPEEPVSLVLEMPGMKDEPRLRAGEEIPAVLRDVLWEGLPRERRKAFLEAGTRLAPDLRLLEYRRNRRHDLYVSVGLVGFLLLSTLVTFAVLRARRPRKPPATGG